MYKLLRFVVLFTLALTPALLFSAAAKADHPLEGRWLVRGYEQGKFLSIWLIELEEKNGKLEGKVLDSKLRIFNLAKVQDLRATKDAVHIDLVIPLRGQKLVLSVAAYARKSKKDPKTLYGSVRIQSRRDVMQLVHTDLKKIDADKLKQDGPTSKAFMEILRAPQKERLAAVVKLFKKYPNDGFGLQAARQILLTGFRDLNEMELTDLAKRVVNVAKFYGPEMHAKGLQDATSTLLKAKKGKELALEYARLIHQDLTKKASLTERYNALRNLAQALKLNELAKEAGEVQAKVNRIDAKLDAEFVKKNIAFDLKKFTREGKSKRAVVVELFTGAQCPPCVSADIAFDALVKTFNSKDAIFLQHHLHIPGPDPLTNGITEKRSRRYKVRGTPAIFINGKTGPAVGGYKQHAQDRYQTLFDLVSDKLEEQAKAKIELAVTRKGDEITMTANAAELPDSVKNARLHFVVIEDVVRYSGSNGQRLHHHVVRDFPAGDEGIEVKKKNGTFSKKISVKDLRAKLDTYLTNFEKRRSFQDDSRPLDLDHLYIVAMVQDQDSGEILNAIQVAVPKGQ